MTTLGCFCNMSEINWGHNEVSLNAWSTQVIKRAPTGWSVADESPGLTDLGQGFIYCQTLVWRLNREVLLRSTGDHRGFHCAGRGGLHQVTPLPTKLYSDIHRVTHMLSPQPVIPVIHRVTIKGSRQDEKLWIRSGEIH